MSTDPHDASPSHALDPHGTGASVPPLLFVISGPSGAGKKTLIDHVTESFPDIRRVPTYTTRAPRPGEVDGIDYQFIDTPTFERKRDEGGIFEWTRTYKDDLYGSPSEILSTDDLSPAIIELDYRGMQRVRASTRRKMTAIFILPGQISDLHTRIERRAAEQNLENRIAVAAEQVDHAWTYDYVLINDDRERFLRDAHAVVQSHLTRARGIQTLINLRHTADPTLSAHREEQAPTKG